MASPPFHLPPPPPPDQTLLFHNMQVVIIVFVCYKYVSVCHDNKCAYDHDHVKNLYGHDDHVASYTDRLIHAALQERLLC